MPLEIDIRCKFEILTSLRPLIFTVILVGLMRKEGQLRGSGDLVRATFRAVAPGVGRGYFRPVPFAVLGRISAEIITKAVLFGPRRDCDYPPSSLVLPTVTAIS